MIDAELLQVRGYPRRAKMLFKELSRRFNLPLRESVSGQHKWLFMWGPGGQIQRNIAHQHIRKGGMVAFFDLGYFARSSSAIRGAVRLTFNEAHPQRYVDIAANEGVNRFPMYGLSMEQIGDPAGHILLIGMGRKSRNLYDYSGMNWERNALAKIQKHYPGVPVFYRPKPRHVETLGGTTLSSHATIRDALLGARLVVCHHSNVGVDAILHGVACICDNGIGSAFWTNRYGEPLRIPSSQERDLFLRKVAWFNWTIPEIPQMLEFIARHEDEICTIAASGKIPKS